MPRYLRPCIAGAICFFTVVSYRRRTIFCDSPFREALRSAIQRVRATHPFQIDAWVLLPDHLHCIWTLPPDDADVSLRWNLIKRLTTQACAGCDPDEDAATPSRIRRRESTLCQRRFREHQIRDDDYRRHLDYLQTNPVHHSYCEPPDVWPHSSLHRLIRAGLYPAGWAVSIDTDSGIGEP